MNTQEKLQKIISLKKDLEKDLSYLAKGKSEIEKNVFLGENVVVEPNVFFDTSTGGIVIDDGTKIKANVVLRGPLIIGKNCIINCFSEISQCRIGDVCKIGGEVEVSIFEGYSNKQHYGFLGQSYIGKWVNMGAGTTVSNMKNTYGTIKVQGIDSQIKFLGCILGDCVKTSINTSIFPGKVIGAAAHLYGTVTQDVPAFTSYVSPGNLYEIPLDLSIRIQKTMMARRDVEFTKEMEDKIKELYKQTEVDREKAKVKKEKLKF